MATFLLFCSIIHLSLFFFAIASPRTFFNATDICILSDSGYLSMALTLQITSNTLNLESKPMTIFAPLDLAFVKQGQPSLVKLQYHISPIRLSFDRLKNLSIGTRIPTLVLNHSLVVTTLSFNGQLSLNYVLIQESAIFDDGSVVIYGVHEFFNSSFDISPVSAPEPSPSLSSVVSNTFHHGRESSGFDVNVFGQGSDLLMSRGYPIMATFLDIQLVGFTNDTKLTIFAPVDEEMEEYVMPTGFLKILQLDI